MFIQLTDVNGTSMFVNINHIVRILDKNGKTKITLSNGAMFFVSQDYQQIHNEILQLMCK